MDVLQVARFLSLSNSLDCVYISHALSLALTNAVYPWHNPPANTPLTPPFTTHRGLVSLSLSLRHIRHPHRREGYRGNRWTQQRPSPNTTRPENIPRRPSRFALFILQPRPSKWRLYLDKARRAVRLTYSVGGVSEWVIYLLGPRRGGLNSFWVAPRSTPCVMMPQWPKSCPVITYSHVWTTCDEWWFYSSIIPGGNFNQSYTDVSNKYLMTKFLNSYKNVFRATLQS